MPQVKNLTYQERTLARVIASNFEGYQTAVSGLAEIRTSQNQQAAELRNTMLRIVTGLPASNFGGLPTNTGANARDYIFGIQALVRSGSPGHLLVVGVVLSASEFNSNRPRSFVLEDLVNGTALASYGATQDNGCEFTAAEGSNIADFIWMADFSGSTGADRDQIVAASQQVFQGLTNRGVDFRMAVVVHDQNEITQGPRNGGRLAGNGFTRDLDEFTSLISGADIPDGCELGLTAADNAIDRALPRAANDPRKIRTDASLAIVYLSDEFAEEVQDPNGDCGDYRDSNLGCTTGIVDTFGDNGVVEAACDPARVNQVCVDRIVQPYIQKLRDNRAIAFGQVVPPNSANTTCSDYGCAATDANEPGIGYAEVVAATGGILYSPCNADAGPALDAIVNAVAGQGSQFVLNGNPISASIRVAVLRTGQTTAQEVSRDKVNGFNYDPVSNSIFFLGSAQPAEGDYVIISYRLWDVQIQSL